MEAFYDFNVSALFLFFFLLVFFVCFLETGETQ